MTDWMVYRCDIHHTTMYANAEPRPDSVPAQLCCDESKLVDVADQEQFCDVLRWLAV